MGLLRLTGFTGAWPQRDPKALPENAATIASNIRVDGGAYLKGLLGYGLVKALAGATKAVYRIPLSGADTFANSYWMEFADENTDVVPAPIVNDGFERYYWASPSTGLKYAPKATITGGGNSLIGGVTPPATAPSIAVVGGTGTTGGPSETRSYTITYIDAYGQESQPGLTAEATGLADATYSLTSIPVPVADASRATVVTKRIYRTVSGAGGGTTFYKVADIAAATTFYSDSIKSVIVTGQTQLESTLWGPPPEMDGLAAMPNGIFVGWKGRTLYFSENYRPHAWPAEYAITVDHPIVGLGVMGSSCVVCTKGKPSIVSGIKSSSMALSKVEAHLPCLSRRSIVASQEGVYWASEEGIAFVGPGGSGVVTRELVSRKQWQDGYAPAEMKAIHVAGVYTGFFDEADDGFSFMPQNPASRGVSRVNVPLVITNAGMDPLSGKPWVIAGSNLYEWDRPDGVPQQYVWRSKPFMYPRPTNFVVFQAFFDDTVGVPLTVRIWVTLRGNDGTVSRVKVYDQAVTRSGREQKLPAGFKSDTWEVEFSGTTELQQFLMASSMQELRSA